MIHRAPSQPFFLLACALIFGAALPAHARQESVTFLGFRSLGLDDAETESLRLGVEERLRQHEAVQVLPSKDTKVGERCTRDLRCYCDAARATGATEALYGNIGRIDPIYTFELVLVDTRNCTVENSVFVSEEHDPAGALARVAALSVDLLKPKSSVSETAVKAERDVNSTPAVVTVMTAKEIELLGITSLEELFRLLPGFELIDANWGDTVLYQGVDATLLYMVDGVPLSNPKFNFRVLSRDLKISINQIERIEFVRVPGSVVWGANAFLGIVNLITRRATSEDLEVAGHVRYGTWNTKELFASAAAAKPWYSYYLATTVSRTDGPRTIVADSLYARLGVETPVWGNAGVTENSTDSYFDLVAKLNVAQRLDIQMDYVQSKDKFQLSPFGSLLTKESEGFWDKAHLLLSASWTDHLAPSLKYQLSASRYEHKSWEKFTLHGNSSALPLGYISLQGNELEPQVSQLFEARLYHTLKGERFTNELLVGSSYFDQFMPNNFATVTLGETVGEQTLDIAKHSFTTLSGYAQEELALFEGLFVLSGGLRYDKHTPFQSILNKQVAALANSHFGHAKLIYSEGFRPPSMNNLYSTSGTFGDPTLRPERSQAISAEVGTEVDDVMSVRAGTTNIRIRDLIRLDSANPPPGFAYIPVNKAGIDIRALYGEVDLRLSSRIRGFANYSYKTLDESEPTGEGIPVAHHTAASGLTVRPVHDLNTFFTASWVSSRQVTLRGPSNVDEQYIIPSYFLLDCGFTIYNIAKAFDVTIKLRNPLGQEHWSPYRLDGSFNSILEQRNGREILTSLSWML